jgi:hypothetical protein
MLVLLIFAVVARAAPIADANDRHDLNARTLAPADVTASSVVLHGFVGAGHGRTRYAFQLGTTTAYGTTTGVGTTHEDDVTAQTSVTGLAAGTTYHARLVAADDHDTDFGADVTFTTTAAPSPAPAPVVPALLPTAGGSFAPPAPAAPPVLGQTVGVGPPAGTVLVRSPGSPGSVGLTQAATVPVGAVIDTRHGSVRLTAALSDGRTQAATFHGGLFEVRQRGGSSGMTELVLRGPKPACGARAAAASARRAQRALWGSDNHGRFRTRGSNSVATVRGTRWYMTDRCDGTLTRVTEGAVAVRNLHTGVTVVVHAGHSNLARGR